MSPLRTLIVGIGSRHGDDQAGWLVAQRLAADLAQDDMTVRQAASPAELLDWMDGMDRLIVCDACRGLGRVGDVRRWVWPTQELADACWSGTHDLPLFTILQLADRLGRLPENVFIWSVESKVCDAMGTISRAVRAALPRMVDGILKEVRDVDTPDKRCTNSRW